MSLLLASAIDLAVVLGAALTIAALLRRQSAALRHAILAAAVLAGLALPALEAVVPQWSLPFPEWTQAAAVDSSGLRWASSAPIVEEVALDAAAATPLDALTWANAAIAVWALGAIATLGGLAIGFVRLRRLSARATRIREGAWHEAITELSAACGLRREVAVLHSDHPSLLVTFGIFRPTIILPAAASAWSDDRCRIVLAHELAHIRRGDWFVQLAAEALRAVYWFNPLTWVACRRLRQESEYACDDAVLGAGVEPTHYATHLLAVARHAVGRPGAWAAAPAIAHPSSLERRIAAMLTGQRNRSPLTRRGLGLALAAALVVTIPTAAVGIGAAPVGESVLARDIALGTAPAARDIDTGSAAPLPAAARPAATRSVGSAMAAAPAAQQTPAQVGGTIIDQSGGVLPGVEVSLTDEQVGVRFSAVTDGVGRFAFGELVPGRYQLDARLPGFAPVSNVMTLTSGANLQRRITLPVGTLQETITVACSGPQAATFVARAHSAPSRATAREWLFDGEAPLALLRRAWTQAPAAAQAVAKPVRVGGQIKAPRKLKDAYPQCPAAMVPAGGITIVLSGRIGVDGYVNDVAPVINAGDNAIAQSAFLEAAMDAVRQWHFSTTLLNNSPTDVNLTTTIRFDR